MNGIIGIMVVMSLKKNKEKFAKEIRLMWYQIDVYHKLNEGKKPTVDLGIVALKDKNIELIQRKLVDTIVTLRKKPSTPETVKIDTIR